MWTVCTGAQVHRCTGKPIKRANVTCYVGFFKRFRDVGLAAAPCWRRAAVHLAAVEQVTEVHVWRPKVRLRRRAGCTRTSTTVSERVNILS